jgi:hypothetical protein
MKWRSVRRHQWRGVNENGSKWQRRKLRAAASAASATGSGVSKSAAATKQRESAKES